MPSSTPSTRVRPELLIRYRDASPMFPQDDQPPNTFDASSLPWTSFTGFTLQIQRGWDHLAPIFTLGRYVERDARTLLPLAVQVHHAAADGYHAAQFVQRRRQLLATPGRLGA